MAGDYLTIEQGDDYTFSTNVAVSGVASNLQGSTLWFLAKYSPADADADAIINASTDSGQIAISGNNSNVVTVTLNANVTNNFAQANVAFWALKCQTAANLKYTLDRGRCAIVIPGVVAPY